MPRLRQVGDVAGVAQRSVGGSLIADLTKDGAVAETLNRASPDVIVHAAALADVDRCQTEPQAAFLTNVRATRDIVDWVRDCSPSTRLVYISTDQVYGDRDGPHTEIQAGPVNIYGWTKLWAEDLVRTLDNALVLRLNYVGRGTARRPGFAQWLVDGFRDGKAITLFRDVMFNPLSGNQAADAVSALISAGVCGTFNMGAAGDGLTKADFALRLAERMGLSTASARSGLSAHVGLSAPRPHDTRMNVRKLARIIPLPNIESVVASVSNDLELLDDTV
jgi:dTDP-4-dehydrorhamnose reductase